MGAGIDLVIRNMHSPRDLFSAWYGLLAASAPQENDYSPAGTAITIRKFPTTSISCLISNTGAANVAIGFSSGVTLANGILLLQGQALSLSWLEDGDLLMYQMWAISTAGGGTIHVVENVLSGG